MKKLTLLLIIVLTIVSYASQLVYITPKGKKYHATKSCRTLAKSKKIVEVDIKKVGNRQACKVCY